MILDSKDIKASNSQRIISMGILSSKNVAIHIIHLLKFPLDQKSHCDDGYKQATNVSDDNLDLNFMDIVYINTILIPFLCDQAMLT